MLPVRGAVVSRHAVRRVGATSPHSPASREARTGSSARCRYQYTRQSRKEHDIGGWKDSLFGDRISLTQPTERQEGRGKRRAEGSAYTSARRTTRVLGAPGIR